MKNIIQRNLPLNIQYAVVDKTYIPLTEGFGCTCDNCNKLIANIATVRNENGKTYNIGFDCLETILINNSLLSTNDIKEYERVKQMIPKIIRFSKQIKEVLDANKTINITGLLFDIDMCSNNWVYFYYLTNNQTTSRDNQALKLKDVDLDFLIKVLKNIFPKFTIIKK